MLVPTPSLSFSESSQKRLSPELFVFLSTFFFFQAEDGIRDPLVTGVQTCALPISEAELAAILVEETRKPAHQCAKAAAELAALARQLARLYEHEPSGESRSDPETRDRKSVV